jgi:hypothetical protein
MDPVEELGLELRVHFGEVLPLPPETRRSLALLLLKGGRYQSGHTVANLPALATSRAEQVLA